MSKVPKDVINMRKAGMKVGAIACYMPKIRRWVLLRISVETKREATHHRPGWTWPDQHFCRAQFAVEPKVIRAKRNKGLGKGRRPYPTSTVIIQMGFKSEREAYTNFLIRGEELTWR